MKKLFSPFSIIIAFFLTLPTQTFAHEAYVLTKEEFQNKLLLPAHNPFAPLVDSSHINIFLIIAAWIVASRFLVILFSITPVASFLDRIIRKASEFGLVIVRVAISSSFMYAATSNVIYGPEINLDHIVGGMLIRFLLFLLSLAFFFGLFTEFAGFIGLVIYFYLSTQIGLYVITYTNVLGELIVLFFFGSRYLSLDRLFFGTRLWISRLEKYRYLEIPILRTLYGFALLYTGYTIKFQHQALSIAVYNEYHLANFFHLGADFIVAGAGLSEVLIGLFMLLGFSMRWTLFISLCFMTLSVWYFQELVWPHFVLYGISLALFINAGDRFTFDYYAGPFLRKLRKKILHF